jgi:DNA-damage-inducible protein J
MRKKEFDMLDATVRARVDKNLKEETADIFKELGLTTSQAIVMFLNKVKLERGIPFELKVPNETTLKAMKEAKKLDGETISLEDL